MRTLFLTIFMALATFAGLAQTSSWPITLTTADGLPGVKIVKNHLYQSPVYTFDEAVDRLRFTVCSTNTVDSLTSGSYDGYSYGWGTGIPYFALSELRIFDGNGKRIDYVASTNALHNCDCGGLAILNDGSENSHFQSVYNRSTDSYPYEYHYLELELAESLSTFSFCWNTRSDYYKSLISYMGITPGTQYIPFPEQDFTLGEKVASVDELAKEGGLFVIRSCAPETYMNETHEVPTNMFFHAPCGGTLTPSAADVVTLTADPEKENAYKVYWLNNGHYILNREYHAGLKTNDDGSVARSTWLQWTKNVFNAASIEFTPTADVDGTYVLTMNDGGYIISYDGLGKMALVENSEEGKGARSRPNTYYWEVYNATISGATIKAQLQAMIDEAEARIAVIGAPPFDCDCGEYYVLIEALEEARALIAAPNVAAADILKAKLMLDKCTAYYVAAHLWNYVDYVQSVEDSVDNEEMLLYQAPDWVLGSYSRSAFEAMKNVAYNIQLVFEKCESLASIDAAETEICAAIDAFKTSRITEIKELPFRVGTVDDGLPGTKIKGTNGKGIWVWESPMWLLKESTNALRFTVFKTHLGRNVDGTDKPFVCINEWEIYDHDGNKIPLTAESFYSPSPSPTEDPRYSALCDGDIRTDANSSLNSAWYPTDTYDGSEYFYLEISLPYPISAFKYKQYCRGNGYDDVPTDFVFGAVGKTYFPEDVSLPNTYNVQLGEQITDVSQITDDGLYALVGLMNCAPEGDGSGREKYYSSSKAYGATIDAPCAFKITKTGDADGTFYIRSLADSKYWSAELDVDGWQATPVTHNVAKAGKFHIVPNAAVREEVGKEAYDNTFAIYMYNDTVTRLNKDYPDEIDATKATPHPYIVAQDWDSYAGYFPIPSLKYNDFDGEGEWRIYKMTMENPCIYWLKGACATIASLDIKAGSDFAYHSEAAMVALADALAKAQLAIDANDDVAAGEALRAIDAALGLINNSEINPMIPGVYVIESAYENFYARQGVKKAICAYLNDDENNKGATSVYSGWWSDAPYKVQDAVDYYHFEFIEADSSEQVLRLVADGTITEELARQAYFIRNIKVDKYIGTTSVFEADGVSPLRSCPINFTDTPEQAYIVREQGTGIFNLWNPNHADASLHMNGHNEGSGNWGKLVYQKGSHAASQWNLRYVQASVSTSVLDIAPEGDVISETYYTTNGVKVATPVKGGITIVKKVYSNGVTHSSKVFLK